jgi:integrase
MAKRKGNAGAVVLQPAANLKPREDFPLTAHRGSGQWCKKINGHMHYFGKLDNPEAAEKRYDAERADLEAGRTPRPVEVTTGRVDVAFACNSFLNAKRQRVESGEITDRTWQELRQTCELLTKAFGRDRMVSDLRGSDFETLRSRLSRRIGPVRLANEVQRVRSIFKYALAEGLIERPVQFGASFVRPSKRIMRVTRANRGPRMFTPEQCRLLVSEASPSLKAQILLGLNGGFTSRDCGTLPRKAIDLKTWFIDYARPKTGVQRRIPLWPETTAAIKATAADHGELAFLTERGTSFAKGTGGNDPIGLSFRRLLERLDLQRAGLGFATLRHVFQTVAEGSRDFPSVKAIMGHVDDSISETYRETISDERLRAVVDCVRAWLFPKKSKPR